MVSVLRCFLPLTFISRSTLAFLIELVCSCLVAVQSLVAWNQFYSDEREQLQSRFVYPGVKMRNSHHFMSAIGFSWTLAYFYVFLLNSVRSEEYCIDSENQFCTLLKEYAKGNFLNILFCMLCYIFNTITFICFAIVLYCLIISTF